MFAPTSQTSSLVDSAVGLVERKRAGAEALHLAAHEHDAALERVEHMVVVPGLAVVGDDPLVLVGILLVGFLVLFGHRSQHTILHFSRPLRKTPVRTPSFHQRGVNCWVLLSALIAACAGGRISDFDGGGSRFSRRGENRRLGDDCCAGATYGSLQAPRLIRRGTCCSRLPCKDLESHLKTVCYWL